MSDDKNDSPLSPENSPSVMGGKKKARRLNSRPLLFAFIIAGVLALTMGMVMVQRSNRAKAKVAGMTSIKSAVVHAKALTAGGEGGMVGSPTPTLPLVPTMPEKAPASIEEKPKEEPEKNKEPPPPLPADKLPEKPRLSEEARMLRNKRIRLFEAAIDSPIKVQVQQDAQSLDKNAQVANLERQLSLLGSQNAETYAERLAAIKTTMEGGAGEMDYSQRGDLSRMKQFTGEDGGWKNTRMPTAPSTPYMIRTGFVIPATLVSGVNSELPGQIVAQAALDVCDSATGKHVLIPQGSKLIGEYSSQVQYGQSRLFVVWKRIVFPDGKELDIGSMPGSSGAGYAGFNDRVNNHYLRIFGSAVMMSGILAGVELTQKNGDDSSGNKQRMADALSESLGQVLGGAIAEMLSKNMNIAPTIEIRPGYRFNVMLVKDLVFHGPYKGFDYVGESGR